MTKKKASPGRPTFSDAFKRGAVEIFHKQRRENPGQSIYASTVAAAEAMGVTPMTIRNWVAKANAAEKLEAARTATAAALEDAEPSSEVRALIAALISPENPEPETEAESAVEEPASDDPQVVILALRRELAAERRANKMLKGVTAYLAAEALKVA